MEYDANDFLESLFSPGSHPLASEQSPVPPAGTLGWGELCERLDELHLRGIVASVVSGKLCFTHSSQLTNAEREWIAPNVERIIKLVTPHSPPSWG